MMDQGPERDHTPDEAGGLFHFAPGDQPLCGDDCVARVYIDDPAAVAAARTASSLSPRTCRTRTTTADIAFTAGERSPRGAEWHRTVRRPCPHCGQAGW